MKLRRLSSVQGSGKATQRSKASSVRCNALHQHERKKNVGQHHCTNQRSRFITSRVLALQKEYGAVADEARCPQGTHTQVFVGDRQPWAISNEQFDYPKLPMPAAERLLARRQAGFGP